MINVLLEAGARIHSNTLRFAFTAPERPISLYLIAFCDKIDCLQRIMDDILTYAIRFLDCEYATMIFAKILRPEVIAKCKTTRDISINLCITLDVLFLNRCY